MKIKVLTWSFFTLLYVSAFAAEDKHVKAVKPAASPAAPIAPVAVVVTTPSPQANINFISLHSGYGVHSSSLTGTGFNSDLSGAMGLIYGVEVAHQSAATGIRYSLKYENATAEQEAPTGVTPTDISVSREEFRFLAAIPAWNSGAGEDLRLGVGYSVLKTGATDTLPNNVMTKQSSQGLVLNAAYQVKLNTLWSAMTEVLLYLPHKIEESPQVTGNNPNFVGAEVKLLVDYVFSENLVGFIGASYRLDQVSYEGTASRGVTNGQEARNFFAIPVGIKVGF